MPDCVTRLLTLVRCQAQPLPPDLPFSTLTPERIPSPFQVAEAKDYIDRAENENHPVRRDYYDE